MIRGVGGDGQQRRLFLNIVSTRREAAYDGGGRTKHNLDALQGPVRYGWNTI